MRTATTSSWASSLTDAEIAETVLARRTARRSLTEFARHVAGYQAAAHHHLLCRELEAVERGEIDRLAVFMPPGSAKTTYVSLLFPAWYFGRHPDRHVIAASHTAQFAASNGWKVRGLVGEASYRALFPAVALAPDRQAADWWFTTDGGEYFATGVGGAVTGHRADLVLLDDLVKDAEAAESETQRDALWQWFTADLITRLKPGAAIVLVNTRRHDDDISGRILRAAGAEWRVVSLPALALPGGDDPLGRAPGEALWPEWQDEAALARIKATIPPRDWEALFQQRPVGDEGAYFKRDWFRWYDTAPKHLKVYGASDYAVTADGGDWTVHVVVGVDPNDDLYVLDLWRGRAESDVWVETAIDLMAKWNPLMWAEDKAQIDKAVGPFLTKRQAERKVYTYRRQLSGAADKPSKARSIQGRMAMGKVYLPKGAAWIDEFTHELLRFPAGVHDDQVDAFGLVGRLLHILSPGIVPEKPKTPDFTVMPTYAEAFGTLAEIETRKGKHERV